jgi:hypothetical protein
MGLATRVTMWVLVTTPLMDTPSLASKLKPPPLSGTLTGTAPLERYISYGIDQAERTVEGIRQLERWIDVFAHVQMEMQASIDSQTSMMYDLIGHFGINPYA